MTIDVLIKKLRWFADQAVLGHADCTIAGFRSGQTDGWGRARNWVRRLLEQIESSPLAVSAIPHDAICVFRDGNQWVAVFGDFKNLQESPSGYEDTFDMAIEALHKALAAAKEASNG